MWLAVLLLVLFGISTVTYHTGLPGSGAGTGVFSYWFRAQFHIDPDYDDFESSASGTITIEGSAPPRFMAWGHASPKYRSVEIDWFLWREEESVGEAVVDLDASLITGSGDSAPLDARSLATLFEITDPVEQDDLLFAKMLEFLDAAKEGKLPRPNHHGHSLPEPFPGRMQHFASGVSLRPLGLLWVICWSAFGIVRVFNHKRNRKHLTTKA